MRRWIVVTAVALVAAMPMAGYAQTPSGDKMKDDKMKMESGDKMEKKDGKMMDKMDKKGDKMKDKMMDAPHHASAGSRPALAAFT